MTTKPKQAPTDPSDEKRFAKQKAEITLSPSYNAGVLAQAFSFSGELDLAELRMVLIEQCRSVQGGSTKRLESMLVAQAHSLDVVFASLARRAIGQKGLHQYETHMKLALKAQSQCRSTLETLAAIKNPPVVFAKQANIAQGPQQVNNGLMPVAHAKQVDNRPTELLEHDHAERLDTRASSAAKRSDQAMETVETIHRSSHRQRKGGCEK